MDTIKRTERMSSQAALLLQDAYRRGYKDCEEDSKNRKLTAKWLLDGELIYECMKCNRCGAKWIRTEGEKQLYCHGCGARMEESDGKLR